MIPFIKFPVPLVIVFRLLGLFDLSTIVSLIVGTTSQKQEQQTYKLHHVVTNLIYAEDDQSGTVNMSQEELFDWIGKQGSAERNKRKRIADVRHIVHNELLPHTGDDFSDTEAESMTNFNKACHLAHAVRKLIRVFLAEIPPDDIDEQRNRNICSSGTLIGLLLRQLTRNMVKALHVQIFKAVKMARYINIGDFFSHRKITPGLNYAFSTGNWSAQRSSTNNQTGICQVRFFSTEYATEHATEHSTEHSTVVEYTRNLVQSTSVNLYDELNFIFVFFFQKIGVQYHEYLFEIITPAHGQQTVKPRWKICSATSDTK
jgi:DNA-directed RNA polymerase beta subunit